MLYPLEEKIGYPECLVGRKKEFKNFHKWINNIPKKLSKSRVILARRKSGKTSFVQRIFNQLWNENGIVIPFYIYIPEIPVWYPQLAMKYYATFAQQSLSFLERDPSLVKKELLLEDVRDYSEKKSNDFFVHGANALLKYKKEGWHDLMWEIAYSAPHKFADLHDRRVLVIIDEFQNLSQYVYRDENCIGKPVEAIPGSFHGVSESKVAPMLVTGSYVRWLLNISGKYLHGGRLSEIYLNPYLTPDEGLQAVYKYAEVYEEPITNETANLINKLCMSDPFFISCVIQSGYEDRDLTTEEGVVGTVNYEITYRKSEFSKAWSEYIELTVQRINDVNGKNILLLLSKYSDRDWTPQEIKEELHLDISTHEIHKRLRQMVESDVIEEGNSDIDYHGLQDGTLYLVLRNRFEKEISGFVPDLKKEFHQQIEELKKDKLSIQGKLNNVSGKMAELQLAYAFQARKCFPLSDFFQGVTNIKKITVKEVKRRVPLQRADGKNMELDLIVESSCGKVVIVEVKKWETKIGSNVVEEFWEKIIAYKNLYPDTTVLPAILSLGGFTENALQLCEDRNIGTADKIVFY